MNAKTFIDDYRTRKSAAMEEEIYKTFPGPKLRLFSVPFSQWPQPYEREGERADPKSNA